MHCPYCRNSDSRVIDSRATDDGTAIRRRRQCQQCNARFTTVETVSLTITKRNGVGEPFSRDKVLVGVRKACQGRPVSEDDLALLAAQVEEAVRATGFAEVASHDVGMAVLEPLRRLDEVAYLRFASVYRAFEDLADFEAEIALLRAERDLESTATTEPTPVVEPPSVVELVETTPPTPVVEPPSVVELVETTPPTPVVEASPVVELVETTTSAPVVELVETTPPTDHPVAAELRAAAPAQARAAGRKSRGAGDLSAPGRAQPGPGTDSSP